MPNFIYRYHFSALMNMRAQCIPCLLSRIRFQTNLVKPEMETKVMEACLKIAAGEFKEGVNSAHVATLVHKACYDILGVDPYKALKDRGNVIAENLLPKAREFVELSDDRFKAAITCAIIGNVMDFGIKKELNDPEFLSREFENLTKEGLGVDDTPAIKKIVSGAKNVAYITDNCGEVYFDRLLLEELKKFDAKLTLVVRGAAIISDALLKDAEAAGLTKLVDRTITTGRFAVGLPIYDIPDDLRETLENADIIIAKGMANYESLSDLPYRPVAYLMRTKCKAVSESIGAPYDANIAKLVR